MSDASLLWYFYFYLSEFNFIQTSLWLFSIWSSDGKKVSCNKRRRNDEQTLLMDLRLHLPEESPKLSAARRLFHRIFSSSNKNTQSTKSFIFQHKQQLDHRIDLFLNNLIVPNWYVWNMIWMIQIYPNDLKKQTHFMNLLLTLTFEYSISRFESADQRFARRMGDGVQQMRWHTIQLRCFRRWSLS